MQIPVHNTCPCTHIHKKKKNNMILSDIGRLLLLPEFKKKKYVQKVFIPPNEISTNQDKLTKLAIRGTSPSWEVT